MLCCQCKGDARARTHASISYTTHDVAEPVACAIAGLRAARGRHGVRRPRREALWAALGPGELGPLSGHSDRPRPWSGGTAVLVVCVCTTCSTPTRASDTTRRRVRSVSCWLRPFSRCRTCSCCQLPARWCICQPHECILASGWIIMLQPTTEKRLARMLAAFAHSQIHPAMQAERHRRCWCGMRSLLVSSLLVALVHLLQCASSACHGHLHKAWWVRGAPRRSASK